MGQILIPKKIADRIAENENWVNDNWNSADSAGGKELTLEEIRDGFFKNPDTPKDLKEDLRLTLGCSMLTDPAKYSRKWLMKHASPSNKGKSDQIMKHVPEDTQVLILGEDHGAKLIPVAMRQSLDAMYRRGFRVLALEVDSESQKLYNDYLEGRITFEELDRKARIARFDTKERPTMREGVELIKAAKAMGFKILCVDHEDINDGEGRDYYMAENIEAEVQKGNKVVFLVGQWHAKIIEDFEDLSQNKKLINVVDTDTKPTGFRLREKKIRVYSIALHDTKRRVAGLPLDPPDKSDFDKVIPLR